MTQEPDAWLPPHYVVSHQHLRGRGAGGGISQVRDALEAGQVTDPCAVVKHRCGHAIALALVDPSTL